MQFYKQILRLSILLCLLTGTSTIVFGAAGFSLPSVAERTIFFEPGATHEWTYYAKGNDKLQVTVGGDLAEYASVDDPNPGGGPRNITFRLELPEELEPGTYRTWALVTEARPQGTFGGVAAVRGSVLVHALQATPFVKATLSVEPGAVGEDVEGFVSVTNWCLQDLPTLFADVNVAVDNETTLHTRTDIISLASRESTKLPFTLDTKELPAGTYTAKATVYYEGVETNVSTTFRIGTLTLSLRNYTRELTTGETNRFEFILDSNWNKELSDVEGAVTLAGKEERTPTATIKPFGSATLKTYLDLDGVSVGLYDGTIDVTYAEQSQSFPVSVAVMNERVAAVEDVKEQTPGASLLTLFSGQKALFALYLALIILVLVNVYFLFTKGRRREEARKTSSPKENKGREERGKGFDWTRDQNDK